MDKYATKGGMIFVYSEENGLIIKTRDYKEDYEKFFGMKTIYSLINGEEFIRDIESGCITDYDGEIAEVFVDGYISNLGLHHNGFTSGNFLVDKETFLDICNTYKVEVNWANK
jgi:hypothetical protein